MINIQEKIASAWWYKSLVCACSAVHDRKEIHRLEKSWKLPLHLSALHTETIYKYINTTFGLLWNADGSLFIFTSSGNRHQSDSSPAPNSVSPSAKPRVGRRKRKYWSLKPHVEYKNYFKQRICGPLYRQSRMCVLLIYLQKQDPCICGSSWKNFWKTRTRARDTSRG